MYPFRDGDTYGTLGNLKEKIVTQIQALDNEYVLKASSAELEQYYLDQVVLEPLVLHVNERQIEDQEGVDLDLTGDFGRGHFPGEPTIIRGTRLTVVIPFEGQPDLWGLRASMYGSSDYPDIEIRDGSIAFYIEFPDDNLNAEQLNKRIDSDTQSLINGVSYLKTVVDQHNSTAPDTIRQALERKRKQAQSVSSMLSQLKIPMRRKEEPPAFALPLKRRERPVRRPPVMTGTYAPEPYLEEAEYEYILKVLRSMSLVIERSPSSFATLDEPAIRTHFLIQLNGHYDGDATGETFNAAGKTDILVRYDNRNVFIAECKFWSGPKAFSECIDQLLGYATWRDARCAILLFNTTKNSSAIREKMHEVMQQRSQHRKTVFHHPDGDSRYILIKDSEPGKEIIVTTQLYDVPKD